MQKRGLGCAGAGGQRRSRGLVGVLVKLNGTLRDPAVAIAW